MNQTDSMLDPTGSRRMRPAQTWWAGRSWRADRVGRNRERICRIATRRDAMPKKQSATPAMPGGRAYDDYTPFEPIVWSRSGLCQYVATLTVAKPGEQFYTDAVGKRAHPSRIKPSS
jgi:hypothetical protein